VRAAARINRASSSAKTHPAARRATTTESYGSGEEEEEEPEEPEEREEESGGMGAESLSEAEGCSRGRLLPVIRADSRCEHPT
jgi:hypothetical protein